MTRLLVKICGITTVEDARLAVDAGADAIGVNFISGTPRAVDETTARAIREAAPSVRVIGVVADLDAERLDELRRSTGIDGLQLHGNEPPSALAALGAIAFKALRIDGEDDVRRADEYGGEWILADAKVPGSLGGTGKAFDWSLVRDLAARRRLILAGGLHAENVARAVEQVLPFGVDVSSGVSREGDPRRKDPEKVHEFVRAARGARGQS